MSAWGKNGSARSCEGLLSRVEANDPKLRELVILPLKKFGASDLKRLARCLESGKNTYLRSLQASGHKIDDPIALELLGRALAQSRRSSMVEHIAIGDSTMGDEGVSAFCRGLEESSNQQTSTAKTGENTTNDQSSNAIGLKTIDMSWKNMGPDGLTAILRVLGRQHSLQSVNLSRNERIGPTFDFLNIFSTSSSSLRPLPMFPGLTHLELSECGLDAKTCASLLAAMTPRSSGDNDDTGSSDPTATTTAAKRDLVLKLNSNDLSNPNGVREMAEALKRCGLVSELHVSNCRIGDEGLKQIADVCCQPPSSSSPSPMNRSILHRLDLSHNDLTAAGVAHLAEQLHRLIDGDGVPSQIDQHCIFSGLRALSLADNPLGEGFVALLDRTSQWISSLEELDLSRSQCGIRSAVELIRPNASANSNSSLLKRLILFGNELGSDDGFGELAKVLEGGHPSLEYLDLGGNEATEDGVVTLLEVLKKMRLPITERDDESDNKDDGQRQNPATTNAMTTKKNALRVLVVGGNKGGPKVEKVAKEVLRIHPDLDIARDKPRRNNNNMPQGAPGTVWMAPSQ